jgi:hypothetical protein
MIESANKQANEIGDLERKIPNPHYDEDYYEEGEGDDEKEIDAFTNWNVAWYIDACYSGSACIATMEWCESQEGVDFDGYG